MVRPTKWVAVKPKLKKLENWLIRGETVSHICDPKTGLLPIDESTFYAYGNPNSKQFKKEFYAVVKNAREKLGDTAENSLNSKLVPHLREDTEIEVWTDKDGRERSHKKIKRHWVEADTTAIIFALKNKKSDEYKDRNQTELSGNLGMNGQLATHNLSDEEVRKLADEYFKETESEANESNENSGN